MQCRFTGEHEFARWDGWTLKFGFSSVMCYSVGQMRCFVQITDNELLANFVHELGLARSFDVFCF
jgi:hypothetical protein